ncbi:MAG TPA: hypothetical protein VJ464_21535 [Blastocatellia bacterium]|nr:hypothetical protein [Blastocatellia bacterium]
MLKVGHSYLNKAYLIVMIGLFLFIPTETFASNEDEHSLIWFVSIYPKNSDYLVVLFDPRELSKSGFYIASSIRYEVKFYAEHNRYLGSKSFFYTNKIDGEHIYRQFVPHPYKLAEAVMGGNAFYKVRPIGTTGLRTTVSFSRCDEYYSSPKEPENVSSQEELEVNWRAVAESSDQQLDVYPYLIRKPNGKFRPPGGYRWVNPNDEDDFRVEPMPDLRVGEKWRLLPTRGNRWVNPDNPNDFQVELAPNLIKKDGKIHPANGYCWVYPDDPNNFCVELIPGLIKGKDGKFHPANGYRWVNPDDPNDLRVERSP